MYELAPHSDEEDSEEGLATTGTEGDETWLEAEDDDDEDEAAAEEDAEPWVVDAVVETVDDESVEGFPLI